MNLKIVKLFWEDGRKVHKDIGGTHVLRYQNLFIFH